MQKEVRSLGSSLGDIQYSFLLIAFAFKCENFKYTRIMEADEVRK